MKENKHKFCSYCGSELVKEEIRADVEILYYGGYGDCVKANLSSRYDRKTGKEQFVNKYTCPSYKKIFLRESPHNSFIDEDNIFTK